MLRTDSLGFWNKEVVFLSLGYEILRVAVVKEVKEVFWLVPVFETFLRRFETIVGGRERGEKKGLGRRADVHGFTM